jgi:predicted nucleic acid-binding protein
MPFTEKTLKKWRKRKAFAVFDSSPLIYLTRIGFVDYALKVYQDVYIPESVKTEVVDKGMQIRRPDTFILDEHIKNGKIKVRKIQNINLYEILSKNPLIHKADAEAICLAEEKGSILVMDDLKSIEAAKLRGITVEPTLTVIIICYALDYIDFRKAEYSYKELLKTQFRVKASVYDRALTLLNTIKDWKKMKE